MVSVLRLLKLGTCMYHIVSFNKYSWVLVCAILRIDFPSSWIKNIDCLLHFNPGGQSIDVTDFFAKKIPYKKVLIKGFKKEFLNMVLMNGFSDSTFFKTRKCGIMEYEVKRWRSRISIQKKKK